MDTQTDEYQITINLNHKIGPVGRERTYEDPITEFLEEKGLGTVTGGGTAQSEEGEIEDCDVEISLNCSPSSEILQCIQNRLEALGAPKGSKLIIYGRSDDEETRIIPIGEQEGMAVYLNGTELPDSVYAECDVNFVFDEFNRLLGEAGEITSHWNGPQDSALYLYGKSFVQMRERVQPFIDTYPLCQKSRIVQIA